MRFSIILPAYKELGINETIDILLKQSLPKKRKLEKIYVVACGYKNFSFIKNRKAELIEESKRRGKAHAINMALKKINLENKPDVIIIQSADTLAKRNTIKNLLEPFDDPRVGITAGRPVPIEGEKKFAGFLNNLVWLLHHSISLEKPKAGEILAFRNLIKKIPERLAADEAYIEAVIKKKGYKIVYNPEAVVLNRGPKSVKDFIKQRRRIFTGHVHLKKEYGYKVSTMNTKKVIKAVLKYFKTEASYKQIIWLMCGILIEAYARFFGAVDFYIFKKVPYMWEMVKTSSR